MKHITIIGGGMTGVYLAYELSKGDQAKVTLVERNAFLGGAASSFSYKDFLLDYGPHKIYTQLPGILKAYQHHLGKDLLKIKKHNSIFLLDKRFDFPISFPQLALGVKPSIAANIGIGIGASMVKTMVTAKKPMSYEDRLLRGFGRQAYDLLFKDLAWKVWGDPRKLSEELARKRVPVSNALDLVKTALSKPDKSTSAEHFYYPKKGMRMFIDSIQEALVRQGVDIRTSTSVTRIHRDKQKVTAVEIETGQGPERMETDLVVSTIGLNHLVPLLHPLPEKAILDHARRLRYRAIVIVYLFLERDKVLNEHWIFFPERKYVFNRIAELKNFSKAIGPRGKTVLTAEITCEENDKHFTADDRKLAEKVIKDLVKTKLITKGMVYDTLVKRAKNLYPVYTIGYRKHLDPVLDFIDSFENLFTIGRQGFFNYNNTDHDIDMAKRTAAFILQDKPKSTWKRLRKHFDSYQIVD